MMILLLSLWTAAAALGAVSENHGYERSTHLAPEHADDFKNQVHSLLRGGQQASSLAAASSPAAAPAASPAAPVVEPEPLPKPAPEPAARRLNWSAVGKNMRVALGYSILLAGYYMWIVWLPCLYCSEKKKYEDEKIEGRSFDMYLSYRFNYWLSSNGTGAMFQLLGMGLLTVLTLNSSIWWLLKRESPVTGMWFVSCWVSASAVDPTSSASSGFIGMISTVLGLVLLAVLLTTVADFFTQKIQAAKEGRDPIVEGGHMVVLGHSAQSKQLLEEVALCEADSKPTTVVIMANMPKDQIEYEISGMNVDLKDIKLICRSGSAGCVEDLWQVGADVASRIVIPDDPALSKDESDAITFGALLTLKGQGDEGWPLNGYITAQACLEANLPQMTEMNPSKTFVLSSETLGKLMVQSLFDQGLCSIFEQLIGFSGDEFYTAAAEDLGITDKTFIELPSWFPRIVPVGVITAEGEFLVNPDRAYVMQPEDKLICLADDDDALKPIEDKPFFDWASWNDKVALTIPQVEFHEDSGDDVPIKALICNFSERGAGIGILFALEELAAEGSEAEIYSSLAEDEVKEILFNAQARAEQKFEKISIKVHATPAAHMTSAYRLKALELETFDHIYLLADASQGVQKADEMTVATCLQMQNIFKQSGTDKVFSPMVEICTTTGDAQLVQMGMTNTLNTTLTMSRALAMVAIDTVAHGVLSDLFSSNGNAMDIKQLEGFLPEDTKLPDEITFAEAAAIVTRAAQMVLVGWSVCTGDEKEWIINPKDKTESRPWTPEDRLVVIKDI
eukprot:TRINITY_DN3202_c0_g1_i1.p1 TRINITY_DN3202_c0_g1~~TRINITY_DN3202_c0_g1_i1.p1  ORF type:complete len:790 (-),score=196.60 TRINITY_DN3202_c0_g1_i1:250-2619(-)